MKNNRAKKILSFVLAASMVFAAMAPSMSFAARDAVVKNDVVTLSEEKELTVEDATKAVEAAQAKVAEAEKALEKAEEEVAILEYQGHNIENSEEMYNAVADVNDAKKALTSAKEELVKAEDALKEAKFKDTITKAEDALKTAEEKAEKADKNLKTAEAIKATADKAVADAGDKATEEQKAKAAEAAKEVENAKTTKEAADKAVEEAEINVDLAKAEVAVAKAKEGTRAALEAQVALEKAKIAKAEFDLKQNPNNNEAKIALVDAQKALEEAKKALEEFDKEEAKEIARIAGKDRYETALNVAKELKAEGSERVVLASGANYADALVGARYAKDKDAVLLLVDGALTDDVKAYLELATKEVTILGGIASVKEEVAKELKDAKYTVERIAGKDRYKTAVEVANKMETVENILVASGENYADALVASAAANKLGKSAVLLTEKSKLNDDAKEYMTTNKETAKKAYVFGGENSVSDETMAAVKEIVEVERVKGEDRDATAVAAAKEFFKESTSAVVASGSNYADALVAGTMDEPVLLVTKNVNDTVKTYLKDQIEDAKVIGGTNSVSDAILKDIAANLK